MRIVGFLIFFAVAFWLGDMMFNNGRYGNQVWQELNEQVRKASDDVRRSVRF